MICGRRSRTWPRAVWRSHGHEIAQKLAEYYKLPMYDHNLLDEVAASMNVSMIHLTAFERIGKPSVLRDVLDDQPQLFPVKHLHHFVQALPDPSV